MDVTKTGIAGVKALRIINFTGGFINGSQKNKGTLLLPEVR
jgi:hypothetical protein